MAALNFERQIILVKTKLSKRAFFLSICILRKLMNVNSFRVLVSVHESNVTREEKWNRNL